MTRKIFKTGHSLAITVSKKSLKELGWQEGDSVDVSIDAESGRIIVKRQNKGAQLALDLRVRPHLGARIK